MQTPQIIPMTAVDLSGKRVFIRADLNVPVQAGVVTSDARIVASLPTIKQALASGARVTVMSHLGRPTEGQVDAEFSLQPVANRLAELLQTDVPLIHSIEDCAANQGLALLENIRFFPGEKANDDESGPTACGPM